MMKLKICKLVQMDEDGVRVVWRVRLQRTTQNEEGNGVLFLHDEHYDTWPEALRAAFVLKAQNLNEYIQTVPDRWALIEEDGVESWRLSYSCYTCSAARQQVVRTIYPTQHLEWHSKRLGGVPESQYRADMEELEARRAEDLQRSHDGRTDWDYEQTINRLQKRVEELEDDNDEEQRNINLSMRKPQ